MQAGTTDASSPEFRRFHGTTLANRRQSSSPIGCEPAVNGD
jgi:hypothetical protein